MDIQLRKRLDGVLECLDSIPCINNGGCGISALAIYRWCKANGIHVADRPFVILLSGNPEENKWYIENNSKLIRQGNFREITLSHVAIKLNRRLVDSTGNPDRKYYKYRQPEQLNESELLIALDDGSWNVWFHREEQIPEIEYALGIDLSDVTR